MTDKMKVNGMKFIIRKIRTRNVSTNLGEKNECKRKEKRQRQDTAQEDYFQE